MTNIGTSNKHLKVVVGASNFKEMVTEYDVFVDKTLFIKEIIDSSEKAILITYPRRWGKTLNLDMLKTFFEPESEACKNAQRYAFYKPWAWSWENNPFYSWETEESIGRIDKYISCNKDIFKKLKISSATCDKKDLATGITERVNCIDAYQGKYPVIFISLKDVVGGSMEDVESALKLKVSNIFGSYRYLKQSRVLEQDEIDKFQRHIDQNINQKELKDSIRFLSELFHKHHGQRAYILVDEYDKPVNHFLEKDIFTEDRTLIQNVTELVTSILSTCGKDNQHLEKIVLTGIFDTVKKEGNSGFNNVKAFGISDQNFSENFGFSEIEVEMLIKQFGFQDQTKISDSIKNWYNGYTVPISSGEMQVYTPWAVMNYLNDVQKKGENYPPQNYWTQSGYSKILEDLLKKEACIESDLSGNFRKIAEQGFIELKFDQQISLCRYYGLKNMVDMEEIFSYLLLNSGYLTIHKANGKYSFSIPNLEVKREFEKVIKDQMYNKECTQGYQELLDKLSHKKMHEKHVDIFKAIKEQDIEKLKEVFKQNPTIKCDDKDLNFSYLHIAAIAGNKEMFSLLTQKCYQSLYEEDKAFGLRPFDYAYLGNKETELMDSFYLAPEGLIARPGMFTRFVCLIKETPVINSLLDLVVGVKSKSFTIKSKTADILNSKESANDCKKYDDVLIKNPDTFVHLIQFEKYKAESKQLVYVSLDSDCTEGYREVSKVDATIFQDYTADEKFIFHLCEEVKSDL